MKKDTHPQYQDITFTCACGAAFVAGSTIQKDFKTEICSSCHPFYTGKQKLVDTSGRIDKFKAKMQKAKQGKSEQPQGKPASKQAEPAPEQAEEKEKKPSKKEAKK